MNVATVDRAAQLDAEIKAGCQHIRAAWVFLAERLYEFHDDQGWDVLGYGSFEEWLASPEIDLQRRHVFRMIEAYREIVVERGVSRDRLELAEITKVAVVLPAVKQGTVTPEAALADAQALSRSDLSEKYSGDPNAPLSAEDEPDWHDCPDCGRPHRAKR